MEMRLRQAGMPTLPFCIATYEPPDKPTAPLFSRNARSSHTPGINRLPTLKGFRLHALHLEQQHAVTGGLRGERVGGDTEIFLAPEIPQTVGAFQPERR